MFRLRRKEPNMELRTLRYLPMPGLLSKPQEYGRAYLVCAVNEFGHLAMGSAPNYESRWQ